MLQMTCYCDNTDQHDTKKGGYRAGFVCTMWHVPKNSSCVPQSEVPIALVSKLKYDAIACSN